MHLALSLIDDSPSGSSLCCSATITTGEEDAFIALGNSLVFVLDHDLQLQVKELVLVCKLQALILTASTSSRSVSLLSGIQFC